MDRKYTINKEMIDNLYDVLLEHIKDREDVDSIMSNDNFYDEEKTRLIYYKYFPKIKKEKSCAIYGNKFCDSYSLVKNESEYYGGENNEYKGNINSQVIYNIIKIIEKKPELVTNKKISGFFCDVKFKPISIADYTVRMATQDDYKNGFTMFAGEFAGTCQTVGKSGGKLGLEYLLNMDVENLIFTKTVTHENSIKYLYLGSLAILPSDDKKTVIITSLELSGTPSYAASYLIRMSAMQLMEQLKSVNKGVDNIVIGLGSRTLNDLGYKGFNDSKDGYKEYHNIRNRSIKATNDDMSFIENEIKGFNKSSNKFNLLPGCKLECSNIDIRPRNSRVLSEARDIRYTMKLIDNSNINEMRQQLVIDGEKLSKEYQSIWQRLEDVLKAMKIFEKEPVKYKI